MEWKVGYIRYIFRLKTKDILHWKYECSKVLKTGKKNKFLKYVDRNPIFLFNIILFLSTSLIDISS